MIDAVASLLGVLLFALVHDAKRERRDPELPELHVIDDTTERDRFWLELEAELEGWTGRANLPRATLRE